MALIDRQIYTFTDNNNVKYYFEVCTDDTTNILNSYSFDRYVDSFYTYASKMFFSITSSEGYSVQKSNTFHADESNIIYTKNWDTSESTGTVDIYFKHPDTNVSYRISYITYSTASGYGAPYANFLYNIIYFPNVSSEDYRFKYINTLSGSSGIWNSSTTYTDRIVWSSDSNNYPKENKLGSGIITTKGTLYSESYGLTNLDYHFGNWLLNNADIVDIDDPNPGGTSTTSNPGGTNDIGGDTIGDDGLPTIQATDSGLMTLYNPSVAQLQELGKFLWSDSLDLNSFKKLFNDPFDTLLGLSIVPIVPTHSTTKHIMFGNLDSGVSAPVVGNQFVEVDMGILALNEVWTSFLDYSPNTQVSIYLPFIGERQLNTNDVMNSSIHLIYKFDVLTGGCVAQLYITYNNTHNKASNAFSWNPSAGFLCSFEGQASINIPLSSMDYTNTIRAMIGAVGMVAGASASFATGNPALGVTALAVGTANSTIQGSTPTVERTGHLSSSNALLDCLTPHLTVTRAHQCKPNYFYQDRGIPSQIYIKSLTSGMGYTQIADDIRIDAPGATDTELAEIKRLLQEGVII